uniref:Ixodegrin B n=1 Tax=Rhipicephalus appendiculatus TaxID=34631 RepID=A0A131YSN8_RHIAP
MSWKVKHDAKFLLLILVISSACTELDSASAGGIVGRPCESSEECGSIFNSCCVIQRYQRGEKGVCRQRANLGEHCSITMFRSHVTNNYYAPYLKACPCYQPRYTCFRKNPRDRNALGVCQK